MLIWVKVLATHFDVIGDRVQDTIAYNAMLHGIFFV
jgi:hypothetical protein